jgi:hypothetical protein
MDNVVSINGAKKIGYLNGIAIPQPDTRGEYLKLCKKFLTKDDYEEVLVCIMDEEYLFKTEESLYNIVEAYFSFPE